MEHFNWTELIPGVVGVNAAGHEYSYIHIATFVVTGVVLLLLSVAARLSLGSIQTGYIPATRFSVKGIFEAVVEFIVSISDMVLGEEGRKFVPMFITIFLIVFVNNIFGLLPGWTPATDNLNTTLAMGLFMFAVYNYYGFKEHKIGYLKQFMGPIVFMAPFMFFVELISHSVRPFSLGLRLQGNMSGDHILLGVFYSLFKYGLPVALMPLGLFVCFMQAFVFTMMGMIYISMAISHDH
jgi:F-type H+-transporting ATPase subunit a